MLTRSPSLPLRRADRAELGAGRSTVPAREGHNSTRKITTETSHLPFRRSTPSLHLDFGHTNLGRLPQKREVEMRKTVLSTIGAFVLLLAGILAWHAEATPLSGILGCSARNGLLLGGTRLSCGPHQKRIKQICPPGTMLSCWDPSSQFPNCLCESCPSDDQSLWNPDEGLACPCRRPWPRSCTYNGTPYCCGC